MTAYPKEVDGKWFCPHCTGEMCYWRNRSYWLFKGWEFIIQCKRCDKKWGQLDDFGKLMRGFTSRENDKQESLL